jgi:hypothetical protein
MSEESKLESVTEPISEPPKQPPTKLSKKTKVNLSPVSILNSNIFFGSSDQSKDNTDDFKKLKVDAVINCQGEFKYPSDATYDLFNFDFENDEGATLMEHIDEVMQVINNLLKQRKKMYIQCKTGDSISPAILIYLLMTRKEMGLERAYRNVYKIRPTIDINSYFLAELQTIDEWCQY